MNFLYPYLLFGLAAAIIPIIIHLFDFRRTKKVYFSNTQLLHQVKESTKSFYNLKHLLILFSRILFIIFLVLAFAQPYLTPRGTSGLVSNKVGIFIDTSFSMSNKVQQDESGLDVAKSLAINLIDLYPAGTEFIIQTSFDERSAYLYLGKKDAKSYIDDISFSSEYREISAILENFSKTHSDLSPSEIILISDFQKATLMQSNIELDTTIHLIALPILFENYSNVSVDTAFISNPFELDKSKTNMVVRLKNYYNQDVSNIPVKIFMGDRQLSVSSAAVPADQSVDININIGHDIRNEQSGKIVLEDYPVSFDNELYFNLEEKEKVKVVQILGDQPSKYLSAVYGNEFLFSQQTMRSSNIEYQLLEEADLIILNHVATLNPGLALRLNQYNRNGTSLLVIPAPTQSLAGYQTVIPVLRKNNLNDAEVLLQAPDFSRPFYSNILEKRQERISMPSAKAVWDWGGDRNALLKFIDGRPYLSEISPNLFVLASPLSDDAGGFPINALFVPVMYRIAANSKQNLLPIFQRLNEHEVELSISDLRPNDILKLSNDIVEYIPDQRIRRNKVVMMLPNAIMQPGHYAVFNNDEKVASLALNLDTRESDVIPLTENELNLALAGTDFTIISGVGEEEILTKITNEFKGIELWRYFLAIALLFLLIEALLIRLL